MRHKDKLKGTALLPIDQPEDSMYSSSPSTGNHSVLRELFGNCRLENITDALHHDIKGLLYQLKEPLGTLHHGVIASELTPWLRTEALLLAIHNLSGDMRLAHAFRMYVLDTDGVYDILTPDAQREVDNRQTSVPSQNPMQARTPTQLLASTSGFRTSNDSAIPSITDHLAENVPPLANGYPTREVWQIEALLDRLIDSDRMAENVKFRELFFATYPAFTSSSYVFNGLSSRYHKICSHQAEAKLRVDGCFDVLSVMYEWVECPYAVIDANVLRQMKRFANLVRTPQTLQRHANKLQACIDDRLLVQQPTVTSYSPTIVSLFYYSKEKIAAALTELGRQIFSFIRPADYIFHLRKMPISDQVQSALDFALKIEFWVMQKLLSKKQVLQRSQVFKFFLHIAKKCCKMSNYYSAFSIISALISKPITNLPETVDALDPEDKMLLDELRSMFKSASWYGGSLQYPLLPWLGYLIHDLDTAVLKCVRQDENRQTVVDLRACRTLKSQLREIIKFKPSSVYPSPIPKADVLVFLRSQLQNVEIGRDVMVEFQNTSKKLRVEDKAWRRTKRPFQLSGFER